MPGMKPIPTKAQLRAELDKQVEAYLQEGGEVKAVPRGLSGQTDNRNPFSQIGDQAPRQERTLLTDVVKTVEARKHPPPSSKKYKKPRKILLKDDFGEPLRWVWEED